MSQWQILSNNKFTNWHVKKSVSSYVVSFPHNDKMWQINWIDNAEIFLQSLINLVFLSTFQDLGGKGSVKFFGSVQLSLVYGVGCKIFLTRYFFLHVFLGKGIFLPSMWVAEFFFSSFGCPFWIFKGIGWLF